MYAAGFETVAIVCCYHALEAVLKCHTDKGSAWGCVMATDQKNKSVKSYYVPHLFLWWRIGQQNNNFVRTGGVEQEYTVWHRNHGLQDQRVSHGWALWGLVPGSTPILRDRSIASFTCIHCIPKSFPSSFSPEPILHKLFHQILPWLWMATGARFDELSEEKLVVGTTINDSPYIVLSH